MLTYSDEVLQPQNLRAVEVASYTFIIDTYHQICINICLKVLTYQIKKTTKHELIDI